MRLADDHLRDQITMVSPVLGKLLFCIDTHFPGNIITHIARTQEEQDDIYLNNQNLEIRQKYKLNPWKSVHQPEHNAQGRLQVRGTDLRYMPFSDAIAAWVNSNFIYDPKRPALRCAIIHDVGRGNHMHLQVHPNTVLL